MKKTNLVWRLPTKISLDDIEKMIELKIITPEEAKELTFNTADDNEKVKALEEQVEFLKELVKKLSTQPTKVVWKYIDTYKPYYGWNLTTTIGAGTYQTLSSAANTSTSLAGGNGVAT